jgi:hypothetical protein
MVFIESGNQCIWRSKFGVSRALPLINSGEATAIRKSGRRIKGVDRFAAGRLMEPIFGDFSPMGEG